MKNIFRLKAMLSIAAIQRIAGIIAIVALIGLTFSTCDLFNKEEPDNRQTPTADDFTVWGTGTFEYDGNTKYVTVTAKLDKTFGRITVKYNGSEDEPSAVGSYTVTFDVAEWGQWKAAKNLSAGELIIGTPTPKLAHFDIVGTGTVYFDPTAEAKKVTVTAQTGKTTGAVTVYYESTDKETYPKVDEPPIFYGTYNVTFDVEEATGWNGAEGLTAGTLIIADGTPSTPTGVSIAIQSLTSLKVSWTSVDRATSYRVYYITADMDALTLAGTVTTNSFTHSGLTLNVDDIYYYYVVAVSNKYGESNYSDFKSIVIDKPVAPNSVRATASSAKKIDLQWSTVSGATGYKVYYNTTGYLDGTISEVSDTYSSASASLTGATANTTYYFWIKAINPFGTSDYSPRASAKTPMESNYNLGIYVRTYIEPSKSSDGTAYLTLAWNNISASNGSIRYYIYRSDGTPNNFQNIGYSYISSYTEFHLPPNNTYYYYVIIYYSPFSSYGSDQEYMSEIISYTVGSYYPPAIPPTPPATTPPAASTPPPAASSGQKTCPVCYGSGECSYHYLVDYCHGKGYVDCTTCKGKGMKDNKKCSSCNGKGTVTCPLCKGNGKCNRCNGKGKI